MSWNSKSSEIQYTSLSDDEYWSLFNFVFSSQSKKTSTYKFALVKSILDNLFNNIPTEDFQIISYDNIFSKFAESYWNLVVKYHLHQQKPTIEGKTSKIEQIFHSLVQENPILENIDFNSIDENTKTSLIKKVKSECKKYVLGALCDDFDKKIYGFAENGDFIKITNGAYAFMIKYKMEIEKLNYYEWAKYLEKINADNVLFHLLSKLELSLPEREPLDIYRKILFTEFEQTNCFYCGKKLKPENNKIHVDHFIPWSFIKEDKLWNFVLACPECNLKKNNLLPSHNMILKIQKRNQIILNHNDEKNFKIKQNSSFIKNQFANYNANIIDNLWNYAKFAGFKPIEENATYKIPQSFGELEVAER